MAFLIGYTFLPELFFIHTLSLMNIIRNTIFSLFRFLSFCHFLKSEQNFQENSIQKPINPSATAALIQELLPVIKFSELPPSSFGAAIEGHDSPESCPVCLYEFEGDEDISCLINCKHIFHKSCLDPWLDYDNKTCPLCRKHLVPRELENEFKERLWDAFYNGEDIYICNGEDIYCD